MASLIALLLSLIFVSQASILILEEGTEEDGDWRQLTIELPPSFFDSDGNQFFDKPIWTRRENEMVWTFPVLGSLICPESSEQGVAARIDGEWICVDIDDDRLPPEDTKRSAGKRQTDGRVEPPVCVEDNAPAVWDLSAGEWVCGDPMALIQAVHEDPRRPECNDRDLVVYNEVNDWFECKNLSLIEFASTISTDDFRWQTPSTARHIGSLAGSGRVRAGTYDNFRWSNYVFDASTDRVARDQTSPPESVNNGGATYVAYTISTTFVIISGSPPFETFQFRPVDPGSEDEYLEQLDDAAGTFITGDTLTFQPVIITFNPNGANTVTPVDSEFRYNEENAENGQAIVWFTEEITLDAGQYAGVEILEQISNWRVGSSTNLSPHLSLTVTMWLQYIQPSGF